MRKANELLTEKNTSESKKSYQKPTLTIVKFMFENDITRGSFETGQGGENDYSTPDGWWED